ncbi:Fungalysin metallopeptidase-domain-containing protein [Lactarius quietus]|nr:Fungalysin metallopeptidase-domain-containing protein [Lactarius quietus]
MLSFSKLLPPAFFAFLLIPTTSAELTPKSTTHRTHYIGKERSVEFVAYNPESTFTTYGIEGEDPYLSYRRRPRSSPQDEEATAVDFLASKLGISTENIKVRTSAKAQAANHVFLVQLNNGVPVHNAVASVAFNNNGNVSSYSSSFVNIASATDITPTVSLEDGITTAEDTLSGTYDGQATRLEFVMQTDSHAVLTYAIQIKNDTVKTSYEAFVDAHDNKLVTLTDFVAKASYLALPITEQDTTGSQGFQTITDPQIAAASPNGWHAEFNTTNNLTAGNNAISYTGDQLINITVETSSGLNFAYKVDLTQDPTAGTNTPGATVNAFYVVNMFHDFSYLYGFTETTFNFQTNNLDKGGQGFDRILVDVHEPSTGVTDFSNGADFAIYPDGQSPKMLLYIMAGFSPKRDSALQNDVLVHECQHGANNRMTGGGTAACYQTAESSGLDEGYADAMADCISQQGTNTIDYVFGKHVGNSTKGLRNYVYSTSNTTNPLLYSSLKTMTNTYDMGSVWANTLHNVYAELVKALGWSSKALTDPTTTEGNVVFFHLLFDALLLQACNPTFLQARDAWIQADANRYGSSHTCLLWQIFASKGFGPNATSYTDDLTFPPECNC